MILILFQIGDAREIINVGRFRIGTVLDLFRLLLVLACKSFFYLGKDLECIRDLVIQSQLRIYFSEGINFYFLELGKEKGQLSLINHIFIVGCDMNNMITEIGLFTCAVSSCDFVRQSGEFFTALSGYQDLSSSGQINSAYFCSSS